MKPSISLKQNLKIDDFEFVEYIASGTSADVALTKHKKTGKLHAIKSMKLRAQESEEYVEKELNILERIVSIDPKPQSFPKNYYGYEKEVGKFKQITYHIVFDYYPHSLKTLIAEKKSRPKASAFPFSKIQHYFKRLVNGLAFLQTVQVCHRDLKPANLLLDETTENIYLMDFGISEQFNVSDTEMTKKLITVGGSPDYLSPEMYKAYKKNKNQMLEINPYKSDVFSLGLIMLEMANLALPEKDKDFDIWETNIKASLEKAKEKYELLLIQKKEKEEFKNFLRLIKKCLSINAEKRPDFLQLFKENININDYEALKSHILIEDLVKIPFSCFNKFQLRGYSQDKNVNLKIWGDSEKIPHLSVFFNEK